MKKCFKCKVILSADIDNIEKNICVDCESEDRYSRLLKNSKGGRNLTNNSNKKQIKKIRNHDN